MGEAPCQLRRPAWLFVTLGIVLLFAIALTCAATIADVFGFARGTAAPALAFPAAIGAGLAIGTVAGRLWRGSYISRREAVWRGALGFGAVGFAWPASFLLQSFAPGVGHAPTLVGMLLPLVWGAAIGAISGLPASLAAALVSLTPAIERPSPARPPE